ncbi:tetratricopeptide repeat protein [Abyssalbus ytuae]|uniref:Tetratricopeptide repeat protein n=1 Tax=Abyssalbus ytuae TaxID=2926907 RepID=A0A9E7D220_9FLAO|nr:tetratricopeptide repeat protein [Abyssalbus ytuae]UOB16239.1 tetratricopeptide repeat protein [Abyssalbus ytuae]
MKKYCYIVLLSTLSGYCQINRDVDSAFFYYKNQLEQALKESSSIEITKRRLQFADFYFQVGVFSEAIDQYNKASELADKLNNDTLVVIIKNNIGKVHLAMKNFTLAENYFQNSLKLAQEINFVKGQAISKQLQGTCHEKRGEYLRALEFQKESLTLFQKINHGEGIAIVNENIGSIYEDIAQYNLALDYFKMSYDYFKNTGGAFEASVLNNLGDIYRKTGQYDEAFKYTRKALSLSQTINDSHQIESAHKDLSKTYALRGDFKNAYHHLKESEKINSEKFYSQNTNQLNVLQTVYETKQKESQIKLLLQQNQINEANQRLLIVCIASILVGAFFFFIYFDKKRKQKLKLQQLEQRMLKAELDKKEFEEKNLQREIHLKTSALSRYSLHLAQKNKILEDLSSTLTNISVRENIDVSKKMKQLVKEINFNLHQEHEWDEFMNIFKEIHPGFVKKLSTLSGENLSPAELRLGMLLRLNLSSKEIASILRVTPDSVRVARYRLRKKLPIDQKEELVSFMISL